MCQLLGMNANVPTDICFSFTGFQARGGRTGEHRDGWGIGFFEGKGVRHFLDPQPSIHSPIAELVSHYPIHSTNVIAHIRRATQGVVSLENTHPFVRELWGHYWLFAHNGNLKSFHPELSGAFCPVGNTDSELAFCWIMQALREKFKERDPGRDAVFAELQRICRELGEEGEFNFLLSNGSVMYAHCSTHLVSITRKAPFAEARLIDEDMTVNFREVTGTNDCVAVIATAPLTQNEKWEELPRGSLRMYVDGKVLKSAKTVPGGAHHCEFDCPDALPEE